MQRRFRASWISRVRFEVMTTWGRLGSGHCAKLRDRDLEVGEDLEQVGLEGLVGAVEFVDEEDWGDAVRRVEGRQQRTPDEKVLGEDVAG